MESRRIISLVSCGSKAINGDTEPCGAMGTLEVPSAPIGNEPQAQSVGQNLPNWYRDDKATYCSLFNWHSCAQRQTNIANQDDFGCSLACLRGFDPLPVQLSKRLVSVLLHDQGL